MSQWLIQGYISALRYKPRPGYAHPRRLVHKCFSIIDCLLVGTAQANNCVASSSDKNKENECIKQSNPKLLPSDHCIYRPQGHFLFTLKLSAFIYTTSFSKSSAFLAYFLTKKTFALPHIKTALLVTSNSGLELRIYYESQKPVNAWIAF